MTDILLATHNPSKIKRYQENIHIPQVRLVTIYDLYLEVPDIPETGENEWENAQLKAQGFYSHTQLPSLALDTGFYINGLSESEQPGKYTKRAAGVTDSDSDEISYQKMVDFYSGIAKKFGGQVPAYFKDVFCLFDGKNQFRGEGIRDLILTDMPFEKDVHFPIASLYKDTIFHKYYHQLTPEEMAVCIQPSFRAVEETIQKFLTSYV